MTRVLEAATWAPNAGNFQQWEFVVVRDPELKRGLAGIYRDAMALWVDALSAPATGAGDHLASNLEHVPVLILVGYDRSRSRPVDGAFRMLEEHALFTSTLPAVQNLMLAARVLGLGTCLTVVGNIWAGKMKKLLGIPHHVEVVALIPLGYPAGRAREFTPVKRRPVEEKMHRDRWTPRSNQP